MEERKIEENKKYSQLSYNNIFTMRKTLEKDNYLSINIIKLPGKDDRSKSLSTRDIFTQKTKSPNKISKVESINIKTSRVHKTEQEIEEEINRRVKITILEREKIEKEKKKAEEEKERREREQKRIEIEKEKERKRIEEYNRIEKEKERKQKEEFIQKERERKENLEKERKQREEKIRKEREEKYLKEKEERNKKEEQQRIEREKQRKIKEEQQRIEIERQRKIKEEQQRIEIERQRKIKEEQQRIEREKQRKIREEQQRIENEKQRKIKEEQQRIEIERQRKIKEEQQRIEKEKQRKTREEQQRIEIERQRKIKEEQQRIEKERQRKIEEEQQRIERERQRKIKEEQQRIEIEKQKKIKEEQERIEHERQRKIKEEQQRIERERQRKIREEQIRIEREKQRKIKEEEQKRIELEKQRKIKEEEQRRIELEKQRKIKEEQKIKSEKEKEKNISQFNKNEIEQTTTTKRIETRNITKYIRTNNIDNSPNNNKTNIKTIKLNEEKKINMSDYILKKDCQKNLEEMKSKLEKEYQRKIEIEKNKNLEEKRRYEEKIEIINKREIEKIKEHQKRIEIERKKELDKEKENQKKKEIELQKQNETEIKKKVQMELEKQQKIMKQKELEEKNQKLKQIKINKVFSYNLLSQDYKDKTNTNIISTKKIEIDIKTIEKNRKEAIKIIKKFILSRGNHLIKLKKYFTDWRAKVKNIELLENAKILQRYCREILEESKIKRVKNNWNKLSMKIFYTKRIKILRMLPNLNKKKRKIYELIRITKLNRIFSRRRFIHYIILIWYIYSKKLHKKRNNMKFLYENLLKTYMSLANDIFGNNQIENPSVQDAMYEVLTSNKFVSMHQDDVPLAKKHYEEMRRKKILERQNKINNIRIEFEQKRMKNYYYSQEKVKSEENENTFDDKRNEELLNKYKQYKSMNRDLILQKKNRYINSVEKYNNSNEKENNAEEIIEINNYDNKGKYGLNNRINSEDNKRISEGKYKYQKIEKNKIYTIPDENKYEINEQKNLAKSSITPINLYNRNYNGDLKNKIDSSPKNNNLGYKRTYIKEEYTQENNNKYIPSYSYKRTEVIKSSKEEPKSDSQNKKVITTNTSSNNARVATRYYSNNKGDNNKNNRTFNENEIIYRNNDKDIKNEYRNIDNKKYVNKIEIKTSSSSDKDGNKINKITTTRSYKK